MKKITTLLVAAMLVVTIITPSSMAPTAATAHSLVSAYSPTPAFNDISGHWAESVIEKFADRNIVSGFPDGSFRPNQPVTRAELARIITLAFDLIEEVEFSFTDTDENRWYYQYLKFALRFIPTHQFPESTFVGSHNAHRSDVAETLVRIKMYRENLAIDMPQIEYIHEYITTRFRDSDYHFGDINFPNVERLFTFTWLATTLGIMEGDPSGYFRPAWGITRAELLVTISRIIDI